MVLVVIDYSTRKVEVAGIIQQAHGGGFHAINYNIAMLAQKLHPDLAVVDGYEGMEGNGPTKGSNIKIVRK